MPWLVGDESGWRVADVEPSSLLIADLLEEGPHSYLGYLLEGFSPGLSCRFQPCRVPLALRAGWSAVAVTARTEDPLLGKALGPFLAPTAPRPHAAAPLGFTLFSCDWLRRGLGAACQDQLSSLQWAARLNALIGAKAPVFCDPILELSLAHRTDEERQACRYQPKMAWAAPIGAVRSLLATTWSASDPLGGSA